MSLPAWDFPLHLRSQLSTRSCQTCQQSGSKRAAKSGLADYIAAMAHNNGMIPRGARGKAKASGQNRGMSEGAARFRAAAEAVPIPAAGTAYDPGPPSLDQMNADLARNGIGTLPLHGATGAELA